MPDSEQFEAMPNSEQFEMGPSIIEITITDLPQILETIHHKQVQMALPVVLREERRFVNLNFQVGEPFSASWAEPDAPHEMQRTATELLIATEIQRRLGFILVQIFGELRQQRVGTVRFIERGSEFGTPFTCDRDRGAVIVDASYVRKLFDLSQPIDIPLDQRGEFEVLDISLESPLKVKSRLRNFVLGMMMINIVPAPVAAEGALNLSPIISTVTRLASAGASGCTIYNWVTADHKLRMETADANYNTLATQLGGHHPNFQKLQICLSRLRDARGQRYYSGHLDGVSGPELKAAIKDFNVEHGLPEDTHYNDPTFLDAVSKAAADILFKL